MSRLRRLAVRHCPETTLDTVLRRYIAGSGWLTDFIIEEAHRTATDANIRHALHRIQQALLDRLITAVTGVYQVEVDHMHGSREQSRAALVTRLAGRAIARRPATPQQQNSSRSNTGSTPAYWCDRRQRGGGRGNAGRSGHVSIACCCAYRPTTNATGRGLAVPIAMSSRASICWATESSRTLASLAAHRTTTLRVSG